MSTTTPKPRSSAFKRLYGRIQQLFEQPALVVIAYASLDRARAEGIVSRLTRGRHGPLGEVPRADLVAQIARVFFDREDDAWELVREMDRAARTQRSVIASMSLTEVLQRIASHEALFLRRQGAKLVWAVARDEREEVSALAMQMASRYLEQSLELDRAREQVRQKGASDELERVEGVYRALGADLGHLESEISVVEKERARLAAEVGRSEAQLRRQENRAEKLSRQVTELEASLQEEKRKQPAVSAPSAGPANASSVEKQLRQANKKLAIAARDRQLVEEQRGRITELELQNERLRATVSGLREARATERVSARRITGEVSIAALPMVEAPKRRKARRGEGQVRVGVFVDVANIAGVARTLFERAVDYRILLDRVVGGRHLVEARAYAIDKGAGYERFAASLRDGGYQVRGKRPREFSDGSVKADWDVGIAVDMLSRHVAIDVAVLVSGDGDFAPVVSALKGMGLRVEASAFLPRAAAELISAADQFVELDESVLM